MADPSVSNKPRRSAHRDACGEDVVLAGALRVHRDIRQIAHVIRVVHVGIGIARRAGIEMTAGALEVRTFTSARPVNVHAVHARRRILDAQNDLHHMTVAAVDDLIQRRRARHAVGALYRGACSLHRRSPATLTLGEGGICGHGRRILLGRGFCPAAGGPGACAAIIAVARPNAAAAATAVRCPLPI